jgi:RNA polymerase sigma-70 factor (ECF subfamily)
MNREKVTPDYAALVEAAVAGDGQALERLLVAAQDVTWRFSMAVCGQPDDAQDAMQEALLKTYRHVSRLREPGAFRPWLYRTVRNACLMIRRKRAHEPARLASLDASAPDGSFLADTLVHPGRTPEALAALRNLRSQLSRSLKALPLESRAVVFLREIEGLSTHDTAQALQITEANVKTRLSRARATLRAEMATLRTESPARAPRPIHGHAEPRAREGNANRRISATPSISEGARRNAPGPFEENPAVPDGQLTAAAAAAAAFMPSVTIPTLSTPAPLAASMTSTISP